MIKTEFVGHSEIIRFLLWSYDKIEIDAENIFGLTALMKTALQGHSHCAKILIVAGKLLHIDLYSVYHTRCNELYSLENPAQYNG